MSISRLRAADGNASNAALDLHALPPNAQADVLARLDAETLATLDASGRAGRDFIDRNDIRGTYFVAPDNPHGFSARQRIEVERRGRLGVLRELRDAASRASQAKAGRMIQDYFDDGISPAEFEEWVRSEEGRRREDPRSPACRLTARSARESAATSEALLTRACRYP